jgi:uncharacterized FlaG/YvyC family protein
MAEASDDIGSIDSLGAALDTAPAEAGTASAQKSGDATSLRPSADLQQALSRVNDKLSGYSRVLELTVDAGSGLTVATVRNSATGAVLSQFPGTSQLELAEMLAKWAGSNSALVDLVA